jgi:acyl-CoA reductase-like NAD-dependent aldehyde dehydrogenase
MQHGKVSRLVRAAKDAGGRVLLGGEEPDDGLFFPLTLIADLDNGNPLVDEEQFGPALPIIRYSNLDDAIAKANDNPNGLGGSIWSKDVRKARDLALQLECGTAWVNKHGAVQPNAPFGGVKASGFGVEFGEEGLLENTNVQTVFS